MATSKASSEGTSTDVARREQLTTEQLKSIDSFDAAIALMKQEFGADGTDVVSAQELGDGFRLLRDEEKSQLEGVECLFIGWNFSTGDFGEFVSCRVLVNLPNGDTDKVIINDGSTGICAQLQQFTRDNPNSRMLFAKKGLRHSDYSNEFTAHGRTYYINTSA